MLDDFFAFLRIRTISQEGPRGAYRDAVNFLRDFVTRRLVLLRPDITIYDQEFVPDKPVLLVKIPVEAERNAACPQDNRPSGGHSGGHGQPRPKVLLLNSHYDVVPVMQHKWDCDAFAAVVDKDRVYARGAQDMKCVCIQYVLALERILRRRKLLNQANPDSPAAASSPVLDTTKEVWLSFVPDEEIGGKDGMCAFLDSAFYREHLMGRIALGLDEGLANESDRFTVFFGERNPWWIMVRATGPTGHGSRFIEDTAVSKLIAVANRALDFRREQERRLRYDVVDGVEVEDIEGEEIRCGCAHAQARKLGDVTTLNLTVLKAGVETAPGVYALNVIPVEATAGFDVRISPLLRVADFRAMLDSWVQEHEGVSWSFAPGTVPAAEHFLTPVSARPEYFLCEEAESSGALADEEARDKTEEKTQEKFFWWNVFAGAMAEFGYELDAEVFPAATDSRFLRQLRIPAFGFSPMRNCPILLHEHNEYIPIHVFWEGVDVYEKLLPRLMAA